MALNLLALGAGQEIGRSCIMVNAGATSVMLDCGLHLSRHDSRRVPDFDSITAGGDVNSAVQAVVITHFHLDHIGALPVLTELRGYRGPVVMTRATQLLAQLMLEDYCGLCKERCAQQGQMRNMWMLLELPLAWLQPHWLFHCLACLHFC